MYILPLPPITASTLNKNYFDSSCTRWASKFYFVQLLYCYTIERAVSQYSIEIEFTDDEADRISSFSAEMIVNEDEDNEEIEIEDVDGDQSGKTTNNR